MNNNDIIRRLRYSLNYDDKKIIEIFKSVEHDVSKEQISFWLLKEDDDGFVEMYDKELASFLNGLIIEKRGKKDGEIPKSEKSMNNNMIFRKIKIAFNLKDTDIMDAFYLAKFKISKHELSAIFRKPGQDQYRLCKDQFLRNFMMGLQLKLREKKQ